MPSRFLSQKDRNFFTSINRELVGNLKNDKDGIINQTCVLYRVSATDTPTNLYGEASAGKTYLKGVKLPCLIQADDFDFNTDEFGSDLRQTAQFWFEREYLTELSLVVDPGDVFDWNYAHFEVASMNENQLVGGQYNQNWSVDCSAHLIRKSSLNIQRVRSI